MGNRFISAPVSATITSSTARATPGMVCNWSTCGRKGASALRSVEGATIVVDSSSRPCRSRRHRNAWWTPKLPVNARTSWGIFGRIRPLASSASATASSSPAISAASIARPETPRMSVATDDSLIPAPPMPSTTAAPTGCVRRSAWCGSGSDPAAAGSAPAARTRRAAARTHPATQPRGVGHVGFAARQPLAVRGVYQDHVQVALRQVERAAPVIPFASSTTRLTRPLVDQQTRRSNNALAAVAKVRISWLRERLSCAHARGAHARLEDLGPISKAAHRTSKSSIESPADTNELGQNAPVRRKRGTENLLGVLSATIDNSFRWLPSLCWSKITAKESTGCRTRGRHCPTFTPMPVAQV